MKRCTKCKQDKPLSEFSQHLITKDRLAHACRSCAKSYRLKNIKKVKEWSRNYSFKEHGITREIYEDIYRKQVGACAICGAQWLDGKRLVIDHSHSTGEVRGLLCNNCNRAIGLMVDNPETCRRAAEYLETGTYVRRP